MINLPATSHCFPDENEPIWSKSEKAGARKVFDVALKQELRELMQETKRRSGQIKESSDLWELEHYLDPTPQRD
jgi:hypothetical protein